MATDARGPVGQAGSLRPDGIRPRPGFSSPCVIGMVGWKPADAGMRAGQRRLPVGAQDTILPHSVSNGFSSFFNELLAHHRCGEDFLQLQCG